MEVVEPYQHLAGLGRPPLRSFGHGAAGVAYALWRCATLTGDDDAGRAALAWAAEAQSAVHEPDAFVGPPPVFPDGAFPLTTSLYFGEAGVWCVSALLGAGGVERFVDIAERCPEQSVDVVGGAAGLLLGLALLVEQLHAPAARSAGERLVVRLAPAPTLPLLGAAHGRAGIVHARLRWCQATGAQPDEHVRDELGRLLAAEVGKGRWPRRSDTDEAWPGWCHGSAGWAQLWTLAAEVTGDDSFVAPAERAAAYALAHGGGGASLCCGAGGHAYAALAVYRATGERAWLAQAHRAAERAAVEPAGDRFPEHSLWGGTLGASLLAVELAYPDAAALPLYRSLRPSS
ncbi:MAG TPA: lanthionine synthetase LanC family protein [Acidimicrobiales bacterium]|nr:lanthionine synthetase LanC family protein [Acidimicrobiales bacterium]